MAVRVSEGTSWAAGDDRLGRVELRHVRFADADLQAFEPRLEAALDAMDRLEAGAVANVDEGRMVGHYWLRAPELAPSPDIADAIRAGVAAVLELAGAVHRGEVAGAGGPFRHAVHVGIGGSALGPQLLVDALAPVRPPVRVHFLDNADPDGVGRLLDELGSDLDRTLVSIVSKSGWTPTPHHVTLLLRDAYERAGLHFPAHAVATSMAGTRLHDEAAAEGWLACLPLWDWVGGRTSVTSAVGLLPAALAGVDVTALLEGAAAMDRSTRARPAVGNPAALMAFAWYWLGGGRGDRHQVVLPYRDRLATFPRYVQQLVMESIGKERDRSGAVVHQGLTVYGHKGSTDQHAYVQQLRDGRDDFFVTFVGVDRDDGPAVEVEPGLTLGDHLAASLVATRAALHERGRDSITVTVPDAGPRSLGALVALFERAVGIYAELVDVNAYHQPGVQKDVAAPVAALQAAAVAHLRSTGAELTAGEVAAAVDRPGDADLLAHLLRRVARDPSRGVGEAPGEWGTRYRWTGARG